VLEKYLSLTKLINWDNCHVSEALIRGIAVNDFSTNIWNYVLKNSEKQRRNS